jgi:hypothetical protein
MLSHVFSGARTLFLAKKIYAFYKVVISANTIDINVFEMIYNTAGGSCKRHQLYLYDTSMSKTTPPKKTAEPRRPHINSLFSHRHYHPISTPKLPMPPHQPQERPIFKPSHHTNYVCPKPTPTYSVGKPSNSTK